MKNEPLELIFGSSEGLRVRRFDGERERGRKGGRAE